MALESGKWTVENGMEFNTDKSEIMIFFQQKLSPAKINILNFTIDSKTLKIVNQYKYLGIMIDNKGNIKSYYDKIIKKVTRRTGLLKLLGYRKDGLRPTTAIRLYKALVRPLLEYGGQVLRYSPSELKKLECVQHKTLKSLLGVSKSTKSSILNLLTGIEPLGARFNLLKSTYFHKLRISNNNCLLFKILKTQYRALHTIQLDTTIDINHVLNSFIADTHLILTKYHLTEHFNMIPKNLDLEFVPDYKKNFKWVFKDAILRQHYNDDFKYSTDSATAIYFKKIVKNSVLPGCSPYRELYICSYLAK